MKRYLLLLAVAVAGTLALSPAASAQKGHFVGKPTCTDQGTFVECTGKVAGLGSTTFRVDVSAAGVADVECTNPGGEVAQGQSFAFEGAGSTGDQLTPPSISNGWPTGCVNCALGWSNVGRSHRWPPRQSRCGPGTPDLA